MLYACVTQQDNMDGKNEVFRWYHQIYIKKYPTGLYFKEMIDCNVNFEIIA